MDTPLDRQHHNRSAMVCSCAAFAVAAGSATWASARQECQAVAVPADKAVFAASTMSHATGIQLTQGCVYEIELQVVKQAGESLWKDWFVASDLRGHLETPWYLDLATASLRDERAPWMAPLARVGTTGDDTYHLQPDSPVPPQRPLYTLHSTLTARISGELFLYLNDAVWPPFLRTRFYGNNRGQAAVQVRLKPPVP